MPAARVKKILGNYLDEDEEAAKMYLTEKHISKDVVPNLQKHMELDTLLGASLQVIGEIVNNAALLNGAIGITEDLVLSHLDTLKNWFLSVKLTLTVMDKGLPGAV